MLRWFRRLLCRHDWVETEHSIVTGDWTARRCRKCGKQEERTMW